MEYIGVVLGEVPSKDLHLKSRFDQFMNIVDFEKTKCRLYIEFSTKKTLLMMRGWISLPGVSGLRVKGHFLAVFDSGARRYCDLSLIKYHEKNEMEKKRKINKRRAHI